MVKLWDISARWREKPKMSHNTFAVAISPDSKFLASLSTKLKLWDAATEELLAEHPTLQSQNAVFSPGSNMLAAEDNGTGTDTIRLLKVPSFEEITNFRGSCPLFSTNGAELVYFRGDERIGIHWRDLKTQEERVWKSEWDWVQRLAMSPDGRSIAAAKERSVWIWKANAPDHPVEMEAPAEDEKFSNQYVWNVAFSPDGHWLASASLDGRARLWNLLDPHEKIQPLKAHSGRAWAVAFSPDGRTLATGGNDTTIKLWNLASLQQIATLRGHTGPVDGLAFSRDGTLLASCSGDGTARLWRAPTFQEIERAEKASQTQKLDP
jgi:WD40 repeat protein